jgi:hypothetical protein
MEGKLGGRGGARGDHIHKNEETEKKKEREKWEEWGVKVLEKQKINKKK